MRSIVLISGGLDSCTALAWTHKNLGPDILPISFAYGQRHSREITAAERICEHYNLPTPRYFNLAQAFTQIGGSSLTSGVRSNNPSLEEVERTASDLPPTFVPGRNIIMLAVAASLGYVERRYALIGGWNVLDYSGYPDCRPHFFHSLQNALNFGLGLEPDGEPAIAIHAPLVHLTKAEIIQLGMDLEAPLGYSWSCYAGGTDPCNECDSCKIRIAGFESIGAPDPALADN
jgi:7-cyano-7-deazaguanine synthase